ncbi:MiaB/RimO family radical SAM methylthiotransferase [Candidatus Gottesmanbacteria bacterium]|nr:MiaB/RimO family radical SAM methylthiotransferase [Candidatus Gottesmanbacteria bacterium]
MKKYFIQTFGCQMNEADSEKIAAALEQQGHSITNNIDKADVIVINTCSVRESAENRVFGLINNLAKRKKAQKIIVTGCILYHGISWLRKKMPKVDEFKPIKEFINSLTTYYSLPTTHFVPIMEGCDHFCSYCVVPYARGRERSRPFEEIVCEVEELARRRYKEITLLGQNVNSYKPSFAKLLTVLHEIPGIKKISFMTSNPWDLTDEIIEAMKLPKIDRYLHLPVQSGDDKILQRMNRYYTANDYLNLVKKIRQKIPDIKIGTDIIVGFPEETEEQFQHTVDLCKKIGFVKAYIAKYSPRPGTVAYKLKDDVPYQEKKRRWKILEELINK